VGIDGRDNAIVQNLMLLDGLNIGKSYEVTLLSNPDSIANLDKVLGVGWQAVVEWLARHGLRVLVTGGSRYRGCRAGTDG
jgi:hypothetical protein